MTTIAGIELAPLPNLDRWEGFEATPAGALDFSEAFGPYGRGGSGYSYALLLPEPYRSEIGHALQARDYGRMIEVPSYIAELARVQAGSVRDAAKRLHTVLAARAGQALQSALNEAVPAIFNAVIAALLDHIPGLAAAVVANRTALGKLGRYASRSLCKELGMTDDEAAICGAIGGVIGTILSWITGVLGPLGDLVDALGDLIADILLASAD